MKHATPQALDGIASLLDEIRRFDGLRERKRGVFYRKSRAFLHFHEDAGVVYADARVTGDDFDRWCVATRGEQERLLAAIRRCLESV